MGSLVGRPKLTDENINFLKVHTKFDEKTIIEIYEEFQQLNPSGRMNLVNLLKMYRDFFPDRDCERFCSHVFRVLDTDHNGFVDFKEFLLSLNTILCGTDEEKIKVSLKLSIDQFPKEPFSVDLSAV